MTRETKTTNEQGDVRAQVKAQVQRRILGMMLDEGVAGFLVEVSEVLADQAKRHGNLGDAHDVIDIGHVKLTNASADFFHHGKLLHGMVAKVDADEKADGLRYLVTLGGNTVERLRRYAGRSADTSVDGVALRVLAQLDVLTRMGKLPSEDDTAEFSARCDASEEMRRLLGLCQSHESMPLSASETVAECKVVEELFGAKDKLIAEANGYGALVRVMVGDPRDTLDAARELCEACGSTTPANSPLSVLMREAVAIIGRHVASTKARILGADAQRVAERGPLTIDDLSLIGRCQVATAAIDDLHKALATHKFAGAREAMSANDVVRAAVDMLTNDSPVVDGALPVAELRVGTTVPDMGELKEWLADLLKLTWAARFPKLDHHTEDNANLANAFADEHRALAYSLERVFHDGTEDDDAPESEETPPMEIGILAPLSDVERSVMTMLARMPHGPTDASVYRSTSQEEIAACEKLVSLGYLVEENTHPTIGRNWSLTDKGRHLALHTVEDGDALPYITREDGELSDAEVEQNAYAMIRGGTCVSAPHGTSTHTVGGARTNVALRMLAAAGLIEQWEDAHGIFWASKTTRARVAPQSLVASHEAVEPTTISTDPLLDAAADAMLLKLRQGPIVNDPERPFSELTYQALGALVEKGKAFDELGSTGERTWHILDAEYERHAASVACNKRAAHNSPFAGQRFDPNDPRNEVHALIAEHGGFGKPVPTGSATFTRDGLLIDGKTSPLNEVFKLTVALLELEQQAPTDLKGHGFMDMGDLSPNPSNASRDHAATCFAYAGLVYDLRHRLAVELSALAETARGNADRANRSSAYWTAELARMPIDKGAKLHTSTPPTA